MPSDLNPYGSAVIGTIQQVCGAAGIALFVSVMSLSSASSVAGGSLSVQAVSDGVSAGFLTGAIISLFLIGASFFCAPPFGCAALKLGVPKLNNLLFRILSVFCQSRFLRKLEKQNCVFHLEKSNFCAIL